MVSLDEATFGPMTELLRRDLLLHCYRFTGSFTDAEDLVQETMVKAWRGRAAFRGEAGLRTWLRRIATHVCLDALRRDRARRTLPSGEGEGAAREVLWLDPLPDEVLADSESDPAARYDLRESVSLAFLAALQRLPPRQRAVLILRDVLALRASEVADQLEVSVSAVTSLLHRARRTLRARYTRPATSRPPDIETSELLRRYLRAWESGNVDGLLAILKHDARLEMPPIPSASIGHAAIRAFLAGTILDGTPGRWRCVTTEANGGPAVALYEREAGSYRFAGLQLLAVDAAEIIAITAYMDRALATRFHMPAELPARPNA